MKAIVIAFGFGAMQLLIDQSTALIDGMNSPRKFESVEIVNERWECSRCGNSNGEWTSICGRCGRSR